MTLTESSANDLCLRPAASSQSVRIISGFCLVTTMALYLTLGVICLQDPLAGLANILTLSVYAVLPVGLMLLSGARMWSTTCSSREVLARTPDRGELSAYLEVLAQDVTALGVTAPIHVRWTEFGSPSVVRYFSGYILTLSQETLGPHWDATQRRVLHLHELSHLRNLDVELIGLTDAYLIGSAVMTCLLLSSADTIILGLLAAAIIVYVVIVNAYASRRRELHADLSASEALSARNPVLATLSAMATTGAVHVHGVWSPFARGFEPRRRAKDRLGVRGSLARFLGHSFPAQRRAVSIGNARGGEPFTGLDTFVLGFSAVIFSAIVFAGMMMAMSMLVRADIIDPPFKFEATAQILAHLSALLCCSLLFFTYKTLAMHVLLTGRTDLHQTGKAWGRGYLLGILIPLAPMWILLNPFQWGGWIVGAMLWPQKVFEKYLKSCVKLRGRETATDYRRKTAIMAFIDANFWGSFLAFIALRSFYFLALAAVFAVAQYVTHWWLLREARRGTRMKCSYCGHLNSPFLHDGAVHGIPLELVQPCKVCSTLLHSEWFFAAESTRENRP